MALTSVSRPTKRSCSWIVQDNVPSRLSPLFLYDSSVPESIFDENGSSAADTFFTGNVRRWNDLSGNDRHITASGTFDNANRIEYTPSDSEVFPLNSSVIASANSTGTTTAIGAIRRLDLTLSPPIENQSFECFLVGGYFGETVREYSSLFSSGTHINGTFPQGIFQLCIRNNYFTILVRDGAVDRNIRLSPYSPGIKNFHLKYDATSKTLETRIDGNLLSTETNLNIIFNRFQMFSNRAQAEGAYTEIRYLAIFGQLLSSSESKYYSQYQNCKWGGEAEINQQGNLEYSGTQELTGSFPYAATRISPATTDRRISLLSMIIKPSIFGQNFSVRIFTQSENAPTGNTLVTAGSIEGFSSSTTKDPQEVVFGTYRPDSNSADTFIQESVVIPANSWAWIAVSSASPFGYALRDEVGSAIATVSDTGSGFTSPHQNGKTWDIQQNKAMPIIINEMTT